MNNTAEMLLLIIKLGIGTSNVCKYSSNIKWNEVYALAQRQELLAIMLDGLDKLPSINRPPQALLLNWIGEVLAYEQRFEAYKKAHAEIANFYNQYGYKMMVLKGFACSLNWPRPNHRPCGDIDIWQFGQYKEADKALAREKGIKIDSSHHHHTVFDWHGFTVENHYDFIEVQLLKSNLELEAIFKELGKDDTHYLEICNEKVYLPSANLHALFLIRHMIAHFSSVSITLRQVLDWAFFVEKHTKEIDWEWFEDVLRKYHMYDFYNIINAICVGDLGFDVNIFPRVQFAPALKEKVLKDIIAPEYEVKEPKGFLNRMIFKFRRWQGNAWKQKLCFKENRTELFFAGLLAHLIKPSTV